MVNLFMSLTNIYIPPRVTDWKRNVLARAFKIPPKSGTVLAIDINY